MPRPCTICAHQQRSDIDHRIIAGASVRDMAAAYGLRPAAVHRHVQAHLTPVLQAAAAAQPSAPTAAPIVPYVPRALELEPTERPLTAPTPAPGASSTAPDGTAGSTEALEAIGTPLSAFALVAELRDTTVSVLRRAVAAGDGKLALSAAATAVQVVDRLSRLVPATNDGNALPLVQSPDWLRTRSALVSALAPYPEARAAVVAALVELGQIP